MMSSNITIHQHEDLFLSEAHVIVNAVNCVGVMGRGIALVFKQRFPVMFYDYQVRCTKGEVKPGQPYLYEISPSRWIMNFPTKQHWCNSSKLEWIILGLNMIVEQYKEWGIRSIAIPALGCGNGDLSWDIVLPLMVESLSKIDIPVHLYSPF